METSSLSLDDFPRFPDLNEKQRLLYEKSLDMLEYLSNKQGDVDSDTLKNSYENILPDKIYKYRGCETRVLESILYSHIYFSDIKDLNDPADCNIVDMLVRNSALMDEIKDCCGPGEMYARPRVACFSSANNSNLLWAHYANGHSGICIEYDYKKKKDAQSPIIPLFPVTYTNYVDMFSKYVLAEICGQNGPGAGCKEIYLSYLIKSKAWQYENEWRLLSFQNNGRHSYLENGHYYSIPVAAVYFGLKCKEKNHEFYSTVKKICLDNGIKIFQMEANFPQNGKDIALRPIAVEP